MLRLVCAAPLAAVLLAGCAAPPGAGPAEVGARSADQCFLASQVSGFNPIDDDTVRVSVGARQYELELFGRCPDVDWSQTIGVRARGSDFVCAGSPNVELVVPRTGLSVPDRCPVTSFRRITPEELEAERAAQR